jgi:cyanate permease
MGVAALGGFISLPAAYAAAGLIGLGMGAEADVMPYLISRYFPMSLSPKSTVTLSAYAIAAAFGPLLMGWSFDRFHSYSAAALILAGAMLGGAIIIGALPGYGTPEAASFSKAAHQTS